MTNKILTPTVRHFNHILCYFKLRLTNPTKVPAITNYADNKTCIGNISQRIKILHYQFERLIKWGIEF